MWPSLGGSVGQHTLRECSAPPSESGDRRVCNRNALGGKKGRGREGQTERGVGDDRPAPDVARARVWTLGCGRGCGRGSRPLRLRDHPRAGLREAQRLLPGPWSESGSVGARVRLGGGGAPLDRTDCPRVHSAPPPVPPDPLTRRQPTWNPPIQVFHLPR